MCLFITDNLLLSDFIILSNFKIAKIIYRILSNSIKILLFIIN